jgi:hypothetical protein
MSQLVDSYVTPFFATFAYHIHSHRITEIGKLTTQNNEYIQRLILEEQEHR